MTTFPEREPERSDALRAGGPRVTAALVTGVGGVAICDSPRHAAALRAEYERARARWLRRWLPDVVAEHLRTDGPATHAEIAEALGVNRRATRAALRALAGQGRARRLPADAGSPGRWQIT